ncbi:MAG: hypothetical protein IPL26_26165 [Leptospiraceae bacterium]|nr:hypothetical protein [Leptospiraceae bacterium]
MNDLTNFTLKFNSSFDTVEEFYNNSSQLKYFGTEIKFMNNNLVVVKIPNISSVHLGGSGTTSINGAIISFLFDLALGLTAYLVEDNKFNLSVTSRINIQFKKPLYGNEIIVYSKINNVKKNLIYSEAWVKDDSKIICAKANGILFTK